MVRSRRTIKPIIRAEVWERDGGKCTYCGCDLHPILNFQVDHVIPFSKGGSDDISNLVASCRRCNLAKRDRIYPEPIYAAKSSLPGSPSDAAMQSLRDARRARAMSIRKLAEAANVSPQTVVAAEKGKPIRLESMRRLAAALDVAPLEIAEFRAAIMGDGGEDKTA